jgi:transcriptional regulator of arginine metabolism
MIGAPLERFETLRAILQNGEAGTQEEIADELRKKGFDVTQSTVSRALRRIGAIKAFDERGETVYRLPDEAAIHPPIQAGLHDLIQEITHNGMMIVIHTSPGSASLIARHLDHVRPGNILGTIAGDDTIFVAPASAREIKSTVEAIRDSLRT